MKKILIAVAVVATAGVVTIATRNNGAKTTQTDKVVFTFEKKVTATAD